ncbi:MAG: hypothetical protein KGL56_03790 [Alphaproteobacteria bacterium]|nr:hypothetical protein [Alphaproteobacteria bacterium]MDE2499293.1 hypothetical protein [Alphaproteobacteria bacterium]
MGGIAPPCKAQWPWPAAYRKGREYANVAGGFCNGTAPMRANRWTGILFVAAAWLFLPVAAAAQTTDANDPAFQTYLHTQQYRFMLGDALQNVPPARLNDCRGASQMSTMRYSITDPIIFQGDPTAGQWQVQIMTRACGQNIPLNVFFTVKYGGGLQYEYGLSGFTGAGLVVQHAALPSAYRAAAAAGDCTKFEPSSASFGGFGLPEAPQLKPPPGAPTSTWWETWTVRGCGHAYDVPMAFVVKAGQTTVHAYAATEQQD